MENPAETLDTAVAVPRKRAGPRRLKRVAPPTAHADTKSPRVLIVDDDPTSRMLCSINLQLEGLRVLEAADGRRGLARARFESPDLVVTDVMMPGFDGFELAEALRSDERTRRIPLIFLSGETMDGNEARARGLGALAYLTKPFDPLALAALVAGALGHSRAVDPGCPAA